MDLRGVLVPVIKMYALLFAWAFWDANALPKYFLVG